MRLHDFILFAVIFGTIAIAIAFPDVGKPFEAHVQYLMMGLLFFSFLTIDFSSLITISRRGLSRLFFLIAGKLILLPVISFYLFLFLLPDFALPALLLSGISTGVVAPFIGTLLGADMVIIFRVVILTSLISPFTLPTLVYLLAGAEINIAVGDMMILLMKMIFIPMLCVMIVKRFYPLLLEKLLENRFPLSLILMAVINFGVFSKYSHFFRQYFMDLIWSIMVAYFLSIFYYTAGFLLFYKRTLSEKIAAGVSFAAMNNVLVIMFASQYFGPLCPTLAAVYMFPYYSMVAPVKLFINYLDKIET